MHRRQLLALGVAAPLFGLARGAAAGLVALGTVPGDFSVVSADDKPTHLYAYRGKPVLVVYEDKDAGEQNAVFKARIGVLAKSGDLAKKLGLFAVADVQSWDFWPAKGFVKDELRAQGKRFGISIWADWNGDGRKKLGAASSKSNLVVLDALGKVLWATSGKLSPKHEGSLVALLQELAAA